MTSTRGRPSSASGMGSSPATRPRLRLPDRPDAEQGQRLGDVVALGAHRRGAPQHEADRVGVGARPRRGGARAARRRAATPTSHASGDGQRLRVDASRSCGRSAARGRRRGCGAPLGPGRHVAAVEPGEQVGRSRRRSRRRSGTSQLGDPRAASGRSSAPVAPAAARRAASTRRAARGPRRRRAAARRRRGRRRARRRRSPAATARARGAGG